MIDVSHLISIVMRVALKKTFDEHDRVFNNRKLRTLVTNAVMLLDRCINVRSSNTLQFWLLKLWSNSEEFAVNVHSRARIIKMLHEMQFHCFGEKIF